MGTTANLVMHGPLQAVILPEEFRFAGTQVHVTKIGNHVILEPFDAGASDAGADKPQPVPPACDTSSREDWYAQLPMPAHGKVLE